MKYLFLLFFISCSFIERFSTPEKKEGIHVNHEVVQRHLNSVFNDFRDKSNREIKLLNSRSQNYLNSIVKGFLNKNKYFFSKIKKIDFYKINDRRPFYFSSPKGEVFLSSGLIEKYIKHENYLKNMILFELIRIEKRVYNKEKLIPKGYYTIEEVMNLSRLPIQSKVNIHRWAYKILVENQEDAITYLQWIQIQNRNFVDFDFYLGDKYTIFKEEQGLREYTVKSLKNNNRKTFFPKSSKSFYKFRKNF